jgi:hypothetical protein
MQSKATGFGNTVGNNKTAPSKCKDEGKPLRTKKNGN